MSNLFKTLPKEYEEEVDEKSIDIFELSNFITDYYQ